MNKTKRKNHRYHKKTIKRKNNKRNAEKIFKKLTSRKPTKKSTKGGNLTDNDKKDMIQARKNATDIIKELKYKETMEKHNEASSQTQNNQDKLDMTVAVNTQPSYEPLQFWSPLFTTDELTNIIDILNKSSCENIQSMIPAFEVNMETKLPEPEKHDDNTNIYKINGVSYYVNKDNEEKFKINLAAPFKEKQKIMCATMLIMGILNDKLQSTQQNYKLITKGGVAVSLAVSRLTADTTKIPINDLDFKIMPTNHEEQRDTLFTMAKHISEFVKYILEKSIVSVNYTVSILDPSKSTNKTGYKDIVKLSIKHNSGILIPILDLDFTPVVCVVKQSQSQNVFLFDLNRKCNTKYFDNTFVTQNTNLIPVTFIYQSVRQMLAEKLYYYMEYDFIYKSLTNPNSINHINLNCNDIMRIPTPFDNSITCELKQEGTSNIKKRDIMYNGQPINADTSLHFLEKFKKSVIQLTDTIIQTKSLSKEDMYLKTLKRKFLIDFIANQPDLFDIQFNFDKKTQFINSIVDSIYSRAGSLI